MICKLKRWLYDHFLPLWCREELIAENEKLRRKILSQEQEIEQLNAYIDGMHAAIRCSRVIIHNNVKEGSDT